MPIESDLSRPLRSILDPLPIDYSQKVDIWGSVFNPGVGPQQLKELFNQVLHDDVRIDIRHVQFSPPAASGMELAILAPGGQAKIDHEPPQHPVGAGPDHSKAHPTGPDVSGAGAPAEGFEPGGTEDAFRALQKHASIGEAVFRDIAGVPSRGAYELRRN